MSHGVIEYPTPAAAFAHFDRVADMAVAWVEETGAGLRETTVRHCNNTPACADPDVGCVEVDSCNVCGVVLVGRRDGVSVNARGIVVRFETCARCRAWLRAGQSGGDR